MALAVCKFWHLTALKKQCVWLHCMQSEARTDDNIQVVVKLDDMDIVEDIAGTFEVDSSDDNDSCE